MNSDEARGLSDAASGAFGVAVERVQDMHDGIAGRAFGSVGPVAAPVRAIHDGIADTVYAAIKGLSSIALKTGGYALARSRAADAPSIQRSARARIAIGAINGAFGDSLARHGNSLALPMTVRAHREDVPLDPAGFKQAFPRAMPRIAVFMHGLCETDDAWRIRSDRYTPYGDRLGDELGITPVYVRYNSGLHISENGRAFATLLDELVTAWPVPVAEVVLIGHSVGGLVARSACHYGPASSWAPLVRHVFMLGTPHRGAPLERVANLGGHALSLLPETRSLSRALNARSAGIKDLRYAYLVDEDWYGHDCDAWLRRAGQEVPFLATANHYFVCATLSREPHTTSARLVGDLLVLHASAWDHGGRGEQMRFGVDNYRHVGGATHFDLLNHPAIYEQIRKWLGGRLLGSG